MKNFTLTGDEVILGLISQASGIKGDLKAIIESDFFEYVSSKNSEFYIKSDDDQIKTLKFIRAQGKYLIVRAEGIDDRNSAELLKGSKIFASRNKLPKLEDDCFYYSQLEGLEVFENNVKIGKINSVNNFGAGDIIEILFENGDSEMYPFSKEIFPEVASDRVIFRKPNIS